MLLQVAAKDREIAGLADKLEAALQAAADATTAAASAVNQSSMAGLAGAPTDNEVRRAIAQAQSQVRLYLAGCCSCCRLHGGSDHPGCMCCMDVL